MKAERCSDMKHRKKYNNVKRKNSISYRQEQEQECPGAQGSLPQSEALSKLRRDRTGTRLGGAVEGQGEGRAGYALREGLESPGAGLERPVRCSTAPKATAMRVRGIPMYRTPYIGARL